MPVYTAKNTADLLQVVNFTGLWQLVICRLVRTCWNKLQEACWNNQPATSLLTTCNRLVVTSCHNPCERIRISACGNKLLQDVNSFSTERFFLLCNALTTAWAIRIINQPNALRLISIRCNLASARNFAITFFWNVCSQPYLMKFVLHDNTHFKRKRSQNSVRSLNCTEWKSAFKCEDAYLNKFRLECPCFLVPILWQIFTEYR